MKTDASTSCTHGGHEGTSICDCDCDCESWLQYYEYCMGKSRDKYSTSWQNNVSLSLISNCPQCPQCS